MNVRMGLIRKHPEWTPEAFRTYWRETHGPLAARVPNLRGYWQNAVTERLRGSIDFPHGRWDFDGFSQLWFDDAQQARHAFEGSEFAAALIADERHFLGGLHIATAAQHVVVPVPEGPERAALSKRVDLLTRRPDRSEDDFRRAWTAHRELVRSVPGVRGCRHNVVIARERVKGQPCSYEELPIDGIAELWFERPAAMETSLASHAGAAQASEAKSFVAEITSFHVIEHRTV